MINVELPYGDWIPPLIDRDYMKTRPFRQQIYGKANQFFPEWIYIGGEL
jgi:hypothetical protein